MQRTPILVVLSLALAAQSLAQTYFQETDYQVEELTATNPASQIRRVKLFFPWKKQKDGTYKTFEDDFYFDVEFDKPFRNPDPATPKFTTTSLRTFLALESLEKVIQQSSNYVRDKTIGELAEFYYDGKIRIRRTEDRIDFYEVDKSSLFLGRVTQPTMEFFQNVMLRYRAVVSAGHKERSITKESVQESRRATEATQSLRR